MKTFICLALNLVTVFALCNSCSCGQREIVEDEYGIIKNDKVRIYRSDDGGLSFYNESTRKTTIRNIAVEWTQDSSNDSLSVYCYNGKRGYYNSYTGEIAVPAQYRRAWIFSEGLAAVQKDDKIGFVNHAGEPVIDFLFSYYGNPLSDFVFHNGVCAVASDEGKCGVIDTSGQWLIEPKWDFVSCFSDYAIVTSDGVRKQLAYDGTVINAFVLDNIKELTYQHDNSPFGDCEISIGTYYTGLYAYCIGERWGLMDSKCHRLTEPLYADINAIDGNLLRAELLDGYSEVILNFKGEVMK